MRRVLLLGIGLTVALVLVLPLAFAPPPGASPDALAQAPSSLSTNAPTQDSQEEEPSFLGVVIASGRVELSAPAAGRLQSVEVRVGEHVKSGQVLARLDTKALERELERAAAGLDSSRAEESVAALTLEEAQAQARRSSTPGLVALGALSEEEKARADYQARTAAARLDAARAQVRDQSARVEQLRLQLSESVLRAPFDGVVVQRYLDPGALVSSGRPLLLLLQKGTPRVRFAIPELRAGDVTVGAPVRLALQGQALALEGTVESISPEVDTASRMVLAMASLAPEFQGRVAAGAVVRVSLSDKAPAAVRP